MCIKKIYESSESREYRQIRGELKDATEAFEKQLREITLKLSKSIMKRLLNHRADDISDCKNAEKVIEIMSYIKVNFSERDCFSMILPNGVYKYNWRCIYELNTNFENDITVMQIYSAFNNIKVYLEDEIQRFNIPLEDKRDIINELNISIERLKQAYTAFSKM